MFQPIQIELGDGLDTYVIATGIHKGLEVATIRFEGRVYNVYPSAAVKAILHQGGSLVCSHHTNLVPALMEVTSWAYKLASSRWYE